ncbi:protein FMC1 homolog [Anabrus simplex]|uniref:protein FMC1 homolog n=1 Tax=Anabrus simplex TaxID=316456 RepID=UPI0035A35380
MSSVKGTLRQLLKELCLITSEKSIREAPLARYIRMQYEMYKVTDQQLCKAREEMKYMAETYLCYLQSQRRYNDIHKCYHGKGDRSVRETADMIGYKLPHDPKTPQ